MDSVKLDLIYLNLMLLIIKHFKIV